MNKSYKIAIFAIVLILIVGLISSIKKQDGAHRSVGSNSSIAGSYTRSDLDSFAQCLAANGLTMYGAEWCSHCKKEKSRFGSSFKFVPYVECPDNPKLCLDKGIRGYPTWITASGTVFEGEQGLEKLSEISGCSLQK